MLCAKKILFGKSSITLRMTNTCRGVQASGQGISILKQPGKHPLISFRLTSRGSSWRVGQFLPLNFSSLSPLDHLFFFSSHVFVAVGLTEWEL